MAAGLVSHNITTASGVTFAVRSWVPDTTAPDVGAVPVALLTDGTNLLTLVQNALSTSDYALPVMIHPDSQNANGQATMANSTSIVVASDQTAIPVADYDTELATSGGMTSLRDRLFAQRYTVLADSVADGLATFWTQSTANGGTVSVTGGEGLLQTTTATNGSAQIVSTTVPYLPGQVAWMNSAIRFGDTGTAGDIRRIGMFTVSGTTPQDGFYYELSGTTLSAVTVKAGTPTAVASGSWSKFSTAPFTLDTNYHSFEIRYTANSVWFYIDNVLRHVVSGTTSPLTATLTLPLAVTNVKTSGATNIVFAIRNIGNGRFGQPDTVSLVDDAPFTPATSKVNMIGLQADETATDSIDEGDAGAPRMTLDRKTIVTQQPHTQGGATTIRKIDLDEAPSVVKASRGQLYGFYIVNRTSSARYLRFYNVAAGSVTVGTTAALVGPIEIPANASDHTALIINFPYGIEFDTAMSWAVTTGFADNDTGAPGANDIIANAFIK